MDRSKGLPAFPRKRGIDSKARRIFRLTHHLPRQLTKQLQPAQLSFRGERYRGHVAVAATDLRVLNGFLVADREGRVVGRVECPMYGTAPDVPDALAVRSGFLARRRRVVPADAIEDVDAASGVIGLRVARDALKSFL
jgi:hypothetical protein